MLDFIMGIIIGWAITYWYIEAKIEYLQELKKEME
jgi:hypothetical protein